MGDGVGGSVPVTRLAGLVEYQEGSVVSRELVRKQAGTVTVFAFDAGQGLSEHTAPFDAIVNILEGETDVSIDGIPHRVGTGEFVVMPAGRPHSLSAVGRFKMLLVMIRE